MTAITAIDGSDAGPTPELLIEETIGKAVDARDYLGRILRKTLGTSELSFKIATLVNLIGGNFTSRTDYRRIMSKLFALRDLLLYLAHKLLHDTNWTRYVQR